MLINDQNPARPRREEALSLLQLLLCIVIIGILAVLLLPAVQAMREKSRSVQCVQNLRQIWQGGMSFVQDHQGRFCSLNIEKSRRDPKTRGFREYLGYTSNVFVDTHYSCPTAQAGPYAAGGNMFRSYAVNRLIVGNWAPPDSGATVVKGALEYAIRVTQPSQTLYVADGIPSIGSVAVSGKNINYASNINRSNFRDAYYLHNGRINGVFLDGHVRALKVEDLDLPKEHPFWGGDGFE